MERYDKIIEVGKFNPYHDARGRFAGATGYASFTTRTKDPKKQHMADMAIAREKERHAAAVANPTNDPEVIRYSIRRGQPMTHEQADQGNANPNYGKHPDFGKNCQSCVVAYEARLRGYDVVAQPRARNVNQVQNSLARDARLAWKDPKTGIVADEVRNSPNIRTQKQMTKWLDENTEEGARYTFSHGWKGTDGRYGHIITVTKEGGKLKMYDPQNGKNYTGDGVNEYMSKVRGTWNNGRETKGRMGLVRIDDKQLDSIVANAVLMEA